VAILIRKILPSEPIAGPDTFHEFAIPADLFDKTAYWRSGIEPSKQHGAAVPLEDGMEVLYPEGGFTLNFRARFGIISAGWP